MRADASRPVHSVWEEDAQPTQEVPRRPYGVVHDESTPVEAYPHEALDRHEGEYGMTTQEPPTEQSPEAIAQQAADRLALALEDVGFDVGRLFPALTGTVARNGDAIVELGAVIPAVASHLAVVLTRAAELGIVQSAD